MIDRSLLFKNLLKRYSDCINACSSDGVKNFLFQEVSSGEVGMLNLRSFLKEQKLDNTENLKYLSKISIEKQMNNWDKKQK